MIFICAIRAKRIAGEAIFGASGGRSPPRYCGAVRDSEVVYPSWIYESHADFEYPYGFPVAFNIGIMFLKTLTTYDEQN